MKHLSFLLPIVLSACVAAKGTGWYLGAVGTDAEDLNVSAAGFHVKRMDNSKALGVTLEAVQKMWRNYLLTEGLKFIAGRYFDHQGRIVDADKTIKLEELHNAQSEAEAAAKLKELEVLQGGTAPLP